MTQTKMALLIGINYEKDNEERLPGCINDTKSVKRMLKKHCGYKYYELHMMTDYTFTLPTKANIMYNVYGLAKCDNVFVHYSGHGSRCVVPLDHKDAGFINANQFHDALSKLPETCTAFFLLDCYRSDMFLDLPYRLDPNLGWVQENDRRDLKATVILLSGCTEPRYNGQGILTWAFKQTLKVEGYRSLTYMELLKKIRIKLKQEGFEQIPKLMCSKNIDANAPVLFL